MSTSASRTSFPTGMRRATRGPTTWGSISTARRRDGTVPPLVPHLPEPDRMLVTILFTDLVGSTERLAELGDAAWRELVEQHHGIVRRLLGRYRGRESTPPATAISLRSTVPPERSDAARRSAPRSRRWACRYVLVSTPASARSSTGSREAWALSSVRVSPPSLLPEKFWLPAP